MAKREGRLQHLEFQPQAVATLQSTKRGIAQHCTPQLGAEADEEESVVNARAAEDSEEPSPSESELPRNKSVNHPSSVCAADYMSSLRSRGALDDDETSGVDEIFD